MRIALERRRTPLVISVCDGGALLFKQEEERPGDGGGYGGFCPLFQPRSTRVWFRNRDEKNEREKCDSRCVDGPIPRGRFLPEGSRRRWPRKKPFRMPREGKKKNKKKSFLRSKLSTAYWSHSKLVKKELRNSVPDTGTGFRTTLTERR